MPRFSSCSPDGSYPFTFAPAVQARACWSHHLSLLFATWRVAHRSCGPDSHLPNGLMKPTAAAYDYWPDLFSLLWQYCHVSGPFSELSAIFMSIRRTPDTIFGSLHMLWISPLSCNLLLHFLKNIPFYTQKFIIKSNLLFFPFIVNILGVLNLPTPGPETHSTLFSIKLFSHLIHLKWVSVYYLR